MRQILATSRYQYRPEPYQRTGIKHNKVLRPINNGGITTFFDTSFAFAIPTYGLLTQAVVKIDLTSNVSNLDCEDYVGSKLVKRAQLQTVRGYYRICGIDNLYTSSRIDQLQNNSNIIAAISRPFDHSVSYFVPLFMFFNERPLDINQFKEDLEISLTISSLEECSLINVDTFEVSLVCEFFTYDLETKIPIPNLIYDTQRPDNLQITAGATSCKYFLKSNENVFAFHFALINEEQQYLPITSYELWVDNCMATVVYNEGNFKISEDGSKSSMISCYYSSLKIDRFSERNPINLKGLDNIYIICNFEEIPSGFSLNMVYEFYKKFSFIHII